MRVKECLVGRGLVKGYTEDAPSVFCLQFSGDTWEPFYDLSPNSFQSICLAGEHLHKPQGRTAMDFKQDFTDMEPDTWFTF